jgi:hypothetical protein
MNNQHMTDAFRHVLPHRLPLLPIPIRHVAPSLDRTNHRCRGESRLSPSECYLEHTHPIVEYRKDAATWLCRCPIRCYSGPGRQSGNACLSVADWRFRVGFNTERAGRHVPSMVSGSCWSQKPRPEAALRRLNPRLVERGELGK